MQFNEIGKDKDKCQHGEKATASSSFQCFITVTDTFPSPFQPLATACVELHSTLFQSQLSLKGMIASGYLDLDLVFPCISIIMIDFDSPVKSGLCSIISFFLGREFSTAVL